MGRAGGLLPGSTAEEHLRIGALEDAGDAGTPLELLLDDRPDGLVSSLGFVDLLLPELVEPLLDSRAPGAKRGEGGRGEVEPRGAGVSAVFLELVLVSSEGEKASPNREGLV
jgi:hypothetical protein